MLLFRKIWCTYQMNDPVYVYLKRALAKTEIVTNAAFYRSALRLHAAYCFVEEQLTACKIYKTSSAYLGSDMWISTVFQ